MEGRRTAGRLRGEERPLLRAALTLIVATTYVAGGLWLDRYVDRQEQLLLGVLTAAVLGALLLLHPSAVRLQTLAVVGIATMGEVVGSLVWGVYSYRLHNLPAFVPPGHGLVYLAGLSLATVMARRPGVLIVLAGAGAVGWGIAGLTVLPAADASGAMGSWKAVVPGLDLPQGNPPSGAASGYVVFDVLALALTTSGSVIAARIWRKLQRNSRTRAAEVQPTAS